MNFDAISPVAELDDIDEEVEAPKRRRAGATLALPAEAIPAELNSAFLEPTWLSSARSARPWGSPAASTAPWAGSVAHGPDGPSNSPPPSSSPRRDGSHLSAP